MNDKMEALSQMMETLEAVQHLKKNADQLVEDPTSLPPEDIRAFARVISQYLTAQEDMMRDLMSGDKSTFYETFNRLNYLTEE